MPYSRNADLPEKVRDHLPDHAQTIYRMAFNNAWEFYKEPAKRRENKDQEETAHSVAWAAVEKKYKKNDNDQWVKLS